MNSPLVMILPTAMSVYNLMIARTFMENSIPSELLEAARVDGCDDIAYFWKILLPLKARNCGYNPLLCRSTLEFLFLTHFCILRMQS